MSISLSDIEQFLVSGWLNVQHLDLSRMIEAGQTVTIILSDGPFDVPDTLPGGAQTVGSKQHTFAGVALLKLRVLTRNE